MLSSQKSVETQENSDLSTRRNPSVKVEVQICQKALQPGLPPSEISAGLEFDAKTSTELEAAETNTGLANAGPAGSLVL